MKTLLTFTVGKWLLTLLYQNDTKQMIASGNNFRFPYAEIARIDLDHGLDMLSGYLLCAFVYLA